MFRNKIWFFRNTPDGNPGGTPSVDSSGGSTSSQLDSIAELFNFSSVQENQEGQGVQPSSAGAGTSQENATPGQQPVVDPNLQTPNPTATQQQPQPPAVSQADIAELRGQIQGMMQAAYAPVAVPQQQTQQQVPEFSVNIPDELVQGLGAEDPIVRKRSLEQLGSGLGQMVLNRANQQVAALYTHISNAIPQMVASMIAQDRQMRQWHDDFYGEYKEFGKTPQMKQLVAGIASQLAQQGKIKDLSKDSHKLVAESVLVGLGFPPEQIAAFFARRNGAVQQQPQTGMRRPVIAAQGARQMGNGSAIDPNSPQGIFDLLSGGL